MRIEGVLMRIVCGCLALLLGLGPALDCYAQAPNHIVLESEFQSALTTQFAERERNLADVRTLLRHEAVRNRLGGITDLHRVEDLVVSLDDETLRELGDESRRINLEVAGAGTVGWVVGVVILAVAVAILITTIRDAKTVNSAP